MARFEHWRKKVWRINRSANRLLIVSTTLDGFSLANHGRFTKFAKLSPPNFAAIATVGTNYSNSFIMPLNVL